MILISLRPLANPPPPPPSRSLHLVLSLFREGPGALHHGNEPLLHSGAGLPHDLPPPPAQAGPAGADPEEGHLPQQELPGSAAGPGPGPPADQGEENLSHPLIPDRDHKQTALRVGFAK